MTTDKNKGQFKKWFFKQGYFGNLEPFQQWYAFCALPFEMKIGVYLAYYDSLDLEIYFQCDNTIIMFFNEERVEVEFIEFKSRNEAYKEAFKKANDLINKD